MFVCLFVCICSFLYVGRVLPSYEASSSSLKTSSS